LFQNGVSDGIHWHLLRCVGGQLLSAAFLLLCIHKGASEEVRSTCYLVRIIVSHIFLILYVTSLKYWCYMVIAVYGSMQTLCGWQLGNSLSKNNKVGNFLYQLDSIASIVIGGAFFAFPKWLLYRQSKILINCFLKLIFLNETHEFCGRLLGAFFMATYIVSSHALHWQSHVHRQLAVNSRSLVCMIILVSQLWSQYAYRQWWGGGHWVGIGLYSTWAAICFIYRYSLSRTASKFAKSKKVQ
uniref:TLC domain-containing protein n=1 Tax=Syphacia muris TaxID=451379 RepID=A0A0N5ABW6_9BILA